MIPCPDHNFFSIVELKETDSTNSYLKRLCEEERADEFTVVTTECQRAGKGQRGNSWESETGSNLTFSMLIRPVFLPAKEQFLISQIISLSIKEELDRYESGFSIKWPNDIYWKERKIAGILIENNLTGSNLSECIIGAGVNINQQKFLSPAPNPVSLTQITGKYYDRTNILRNILQRFAGYYEELKNRNTGNIADRYHAALFRKEGFHPYADRDGTFIARILRTEPGGFLVLRDTDGRERNYAFKEVSFLPE